MSTTELRFRLETSGVPVGALELLHCIVPDVEVPLTPQDFAAGVDPELAAAVGWLLAQ